MRGFILRLTLLLSPSLNFPFQLIDLSFIKIDFHFTQLLRDVFILLRKLLSKICVAAHLFLKIEFKSWENISNGLFLKSDDNQRVWEGFTT